MRSLHTTIGYATVAGMLLLGVLTAPPAGAATFTYQGMLSDAEGPVTNGMAMRFYLWDAAAGGNHLGGVFTDPNVVVTDGLFTVDIDTTIFGTDAFNGDPRWLEVLVYDPDGATWVTLSPRQPINPAPYALYAYDGAGGGGSCLWSENGSDIYYTAGNVGIGYNIPTVPLYVQGDDSTTIFANNQSTGSSGNGVEAQTSATSAAGVVGRNNSTSGYTAGVAGYAYSQNGSGVSGQNGASSGSAVGVSGRSNNSPSGRGVSGTAAATSGANYGVYGETQSESGYGVYGLAPGEGTGVAGYSGQGHGYLGWSGGGAYGYSTDVYGVKGYSENSWGVFGNVPYGSTRAGVVGAITLSNGAIMYVSETGVCGSSESGYGVSGRVISGKAVYGTQDDTGNFGYLATPTEGAYGETSRSSSYGVHGKATGNYATANGVYGEVTGSTYGIGVRGSASNSNGAGVYGYNDGGGAGGHFYATGGYAGRFTNSGDHCVYIDHNDNGTYNTAALRIDSTGTNEPVGVDVRVDAEYGRLANFELSNASWYTGTSFTVTSDCGGDVAEFINTNTTNSDSTDYAVVAKHDGSGSGVYAEGAARGVSAMVYPDGSSTYYGLYAYVSGGSGTNRAVYGRALGGTTNYAGYFYGNVHVTGTLSKGGGSFKIDHPLDPENKYLYHSFVESPDMMNIYNGNVVLDENGEAVVTLPEWFEALNMEFRYQLTCIGGFAPVFVAEEIKDNQFRIAGGKAGLKVSWQVTGIRHDPFANANRIPVEEDKPDDEVGTYLHPKAWDVPEELQVDTVREQRELEQQRAAAAETKTVE